MYKNSIHPFIPHPCDCLLFSHSFIHLFFSPHRQIFHVTTTGHTDHYLRLILMLFFQTIGHLCILNMQLTFPQENVHLICNAGKEYSAFHSSHSSSKSTKPSSNYFLGLNSVLFSLTVSQESCNHTFVLFPLFVVYPAVKMIVFQGTGRKGGNSDLDSPESFIWLKRLAFDIFSSVTSTPPSN